MSPPKQSMEAPTEAETELDIRRVIMPAMVNLFLAEAFEGVDQTPMSWDWVHFPGIAELEEINFCPAITSTYAMFHAATNRLKDSAVLEEFITPEQSEHLQWLEWSACSPDHHYKTNFMTSYPAFALGFIHEAVYAGDVEEPQTVGEVLALMQSADFHDLLRQGMFTQSGLWKQSSGTPPWRIFSELRHLYDYGDESPFVTKEDGSRSLAPKILRFLHGKMREANQSDKKAAFRCPVAVHAIRGLSDDPASPAHLSGEQIEGLLKPRTDGDALAVREEDGSLRIQFEALDTLRDYYVRTTLQSLEEIGAPVIIEHRMSPHQNTVRYIDPSEPVPPTMQPDPDPDCPQTNRDPTIWISKRQPCTCAQ